MRAKAVSVALLVAVGSALSPAPAEAQSLSIPFTKTTLKNGMVVILHEDHAVPIAAVNIIYNVGSRMETAHRTGFAHLFEHLMFMGTRRAPTKMFDAWMEAAGGWNNAGTGEDHTDYYDIAPPTALPLLLWLEADRLRDIGPTMTLPKLNAQRDIVRNERRQTSENVPYGVAELLIPELLYPENHPYHHPVIGSHADLEAATVDDVKQFFATWYDPANASLVVAGDFDAKDAMAKIEAWFGTIPSRGKPQDPGAPGFDPNKTTLTGVVRKTVEDRVELPRTYMVWQSPKHFAPGDADLDLFASILAGGKASRLYKKLVYDLKLAQEVEAVQESGALGSRFVISVTARPGVSLDAIEAAVDKELDALRAADPTDEEITRAKNLVDAAFVTRLQRVAERAALLNSYQVELGDPGFADKDRERYRAATKATVRAAAQKTLLPDARVILRVVPRKETNEGGAR